jgi:hypothetical protein
MQHVDVIREPLQAIIEAPADRVCVGLILAAD